MEKVLFISHDANRAGAQIVLLQLLQQLQGSSFSMQLLLGKEGILRENFEQILPTYCYPNNSDIVFHRALDRFVNKWATYKWWQKKVFDTKLQQLKTTIISQKFDLIFVNSIASANIYRELGLGNMPTILFAHELEMSVNKYSQPDDMLYLMQHTKHLIVVSNAVADYFHKTYSYPKNQISTFQIIDTPHLLAKIEEGKQTDIRKLLKLPADAIVIGGCGHAEWRKGNDIFTILAHQVISQTPQLPIYFIWVGMRKDSEIYEIQRFDAKKLNLAERIIHIDLTSEVFQYLSQFDIFVLTSREDPYPLVVLEAALAEKPIVCFEDAGGAPELVETDAGFVVPYLDVNKMTEKVIELIHNKSLRHQLGNTAKQKVLDRHNTQQSVQKVINIINEVVA